MKKQIGRIYIRDSSKSPVKVPETNENCQIDDQRTIRKDSNSFNMVSLQYSKYKKYQQTSRNKGSKFESIKSQKSKQFSSIRQSSMLSMQDSVCLTDSKFSCYQINNPNQSLRHNESNFADSLAIYENPITKNNEIVKKLSHLNNIFKEIKNLRNEKLNRSTIHEINQTERDLIQIQRDILRTC